MLMISFLVGISLFYNPLKITMGYNFYNHRPLGEVYLNTVGFKVKNVSVGVSFHYFSYVQTTKYIEFGKKVQTTVGEYERARVIYENIDHFGVMNIGFSFKRINFRLTIPLWVINDDWYMWGLIRYFDSDSSLSFLDCQSEPLFFIKPSLCYQFKGNKYGLLKLEAGLFLLKFPSLRGYDYSTSLEPSPLSNKIKTFFISPYVQANCDFSKIEISRHNTLTDMALNIGICTELTLCFFFYAPYIDEVPLSTRLFTASLWTMNTLVTSFLEHKVKEKYGNKWFIKLLSGASTGLIWGAGNLLFAGLTDAEIYLGSGDYLATTYSCVTVLGIGMLSHVLTSLIFD